MELPKIEIDSKLSNKIYDDLFSPWLKKTWEWLWYLIWLVPSILMPFALINQYTNFILKKNLVKLEKKLEDVKNEDIIKVPPELWVPILEKLTFYDNDLLVDIFTELLKNAMDGKSVYKVHPRFIKIVENLSEDDALILQYFWKIKKNSSCVLPCLDVNIKSWNWYNTLYSNISFILRDVKLNNFEYWNLYLNNLESLWLIDIDDTKFLTESSRYDELIDYFKPEIIAWAPGILEESIDYKKKFINVTPLWIEFLDLVFWKDKK